MTLKPKKITRQELIELRKAQKEINFWDDKLERDALITQYGTEEGNLCLGTTAHPEIPDHELPEPECAVEEMHSTVVTHIFCFMCNKFGECLLDGTFFLETSCPKY